MNKSTQLLCAHSGLAFCALLGLGVFGIAGWLPVIKPSMGAADLASLFVQDHTRIRIGMMLMGVSSVLFWSFAAAISTQMKRIEGQQHPLSLVQMATATGTVMVVLLTAYLWLAVAYRPESTSPETIQILNDFAWLMFIGVFPPAALQNVVIGLCVLSDKSATPVFPRWVAFANFWLAVTYLPGMLLPFFKTGPFAWNGLFGFWLVAVAFFGWIVMMWWATVQAINQQARLEAAG